MVGALPFAILCSSLPVRVDQLRKPANIIAIGNFAMCMIVISSRYGLWQNWFRAECFMFTTCAQAITVRGEQDIDAALDAHKMPGTDDPRGPNP